MTVNRSRVLLVILLLMLSNIFITKAFGMDYYVSARDNSAVIGASGNYGSNYVMVNPIDDRLNNLDVYHVNSIYVWIDKDNYVEIGWVRRGSWGYTRTFWAYKYRGTIFGGLSNNNSGLLDAVSGGQNISFKVARDFALSNYTWKWFVNGALKKTATFNFLKGTPVGGSEKSISDANDYSHWWSLQIKRLDGTYRNWLDLQSADDADYDPIYHLQKVSNTEFYTTHD